MINRVSQMITRHRSEGGQTMTEYALILAAVAIVAIATYVTLGTTINGLINKVIACL